MDQAAPSVLNLSSPCLAFFPSHLFFFFLWLHLFKTSKSNLNMVLFLLTSRAGAAFFLPLQC